MWILFAFLSALFASLVAIFGKIGLKDIDSTLATTIRSVVMALFLILVSFSLRKFNGFSTDFFGSREFLFIVFSGVAGALSWLFYFFALKNGDATTVSAIDRLSIVFVAILAGLFLSEGFTVYKIVGVAMIAVGAFLTILK